MVVVFPHRDHSGECQEERVCVCGGGGGAGHCRRSAFSAGLVLNLKECLQGSGGSPWAKRRWVFSDRSALGRRAGESEDLWRASDVAA